MRRIVARLRMSATRSVPAAFAARRAGRARGWNAALRWSVLIALASAVAVWATAQDARRPRVEVRRPQQAPVRVAPVRSVEEVRELRVPGTTRAARRAQLSFVVAGRLSERLAAVGDRVETGAPLARLDPLPFRNGLEAAEAALAEARARFELSERQRRRSMELYERGIVSHQHLEEAAASETQLRAALALASSRVGEARRRLVEATLTAPFAGIITAVVFEPGEYVGAGVPVIMVSGDRDLELEVELPESAASGLGPGDAARVEIPLTGISVSARLKSVARASEGSGRLFPVVAELESAPGILPGMAAELVLQSARGRRLAVPLPSIIDPSGRHPYVFRARGGHARRVPVEIGTLVDDHVTIDAELAEGDSVVVAGHTVLLDGDAIEVR